MIQSTSTSQQFTPFPLSPHDAKPFSVDALFHRAWDRFRSRFVKVLLTQLLGFGLIVLASVGICLILGLFVLIGVLFHNPLLYLILVPLGLAALLFYIYLLLWTNLSYVRILIREDQIAGVWQNMVETKPWIFPYLVFSLLISLFSFGFGYLLFIPSLIWLFWGTFAVFTFLDDRSDGLQPLWRSRQLMKGYFWPVVGRLLLYSIGAYGLILIFSLNRYTSVISFVLSLVVVQPLQIAFTYQMYLELKKMNQIKDKVSSELRP